jgi:hypothetical protein
MASQSRLLASMDANLIIALASLLSGLGAATAAVLAAYALRAQQHGQRKQHDLDNMRWLAEEWLAIRPHRRAAAQSLLDGKPDWDSLREVFNFLETCGYLVHEDLIRVRTLDMSVGEIAVRGWWHWSKTFIQEIKANMGGAKFWDEAEWLQQRLEPLLPDGAWLENFLEREASQSGAVIGKRGRSEIRR